MNHDARHAQGERSLRNDAVYNSFYKSWRHVSMNLS
jgi:hypothetical protein